MVSLVINDEQPRVLFEFPEFTLGELVEILHCFFLVSPLLPVKRAPFISLQGPKFKRVSICDDETGINTGQQIFKCATPRHEVPHAVIITAFEFLTCLSVDKEHAKSIFDLSLIHI